MTVICITGSVGSGKTRLSKLLTKQLDFDYLNLSEIIKKERLYDYYDKKDESYVVDVKKLNSFLIKLINERNVILDSHLSHYLPKRYVDLCIITICDIKELHKRLESRKYSKRKIKENIEVEIFDTFILECKKMKHNILIVDTTNGYDIRSISNYIKKEII